MNMAQYLYLSLLLLPVLGCEATKAPLYTTGTEDQAVDGQYLVVVRSNSPQVHSKIRLLSALWVSRAQDSLNLLREFHIGGWHALLVRAGEDVIESVRSMEEVLMVEANRRVSLHNPVEQNVVNNMNVTTDKGNTTTQEHSTASSSTTKSSTTQSTTVRSPKTSTLVPAPTTMDPSKCVRQETGADIWGLSRINSRALPTYPDAVYEYSGVDDGHGVDAYVVDSGIYTQHAEILGRSSWGMTASGVRAEGDDDLTGHGTHVAGIIAGTTYGVAKKANVISVKVLDKEGEGTISDILEGLEWILEREMSRPHPRRSVVNLSLGSKGIVYSLDAAIQEAVKAGVIFVVAAGNDYREACSNSPARIASVITVGATDTSDRIAVFSNYGPCVNILAPGQDILSSYMGGEDAATVLSGTSQASPYVTGVIARYLSSIVGEKAPTPAQVMTLLTDTATTDTIVFEGLWETTTPDRLLYRACTGHQVPGQTVSTTINIPDNSAAHLTQLNISTLLLVIAVISVSSVKTRQ